jgi:hypothetical protein
MAFCNSASFIRLSKKSLELTASSAILGWRGGGIHQTWRGVLEDAHGLQPARKAACGSPHQHPFYTSTKIGDRIMGDDLIIQRLRKAEDVAESLPFLTAW